MEPARLVQLGSLDLLVQPSSVLLVRQASVSLDPLEMLDQQVQREVQPERLVSLVQQDQLVCLFRDRLDLRDLQVFRVRP